ncbi:MAG: DNA polymerase III subunit delta [Betaproteobacteria bacterium]|nr:DNA polymerase III subunit delta [Betaproteobacteria bacterium]
MQLRAEQLAAHLANAQARSTSALASLYVIHGDEPLLALEAADAIRAAARAQGCDEREVLTVERGFDWGELAQAGASRSLFGGRKIIELRIASGKPGIQGSTALLAMCERLARAPSGSTRLGEENVTLVSVPRLRKDEQNARWFLALAGAGVVVDIYPIERARLPEWIATRLARQGQRATPEALGYLADRVEGNLLAAYQEVQKLGLLLPKGEVSVEQLSGAIANVTRYDAHDCSAALLAGDMGRYVRVLDGLRGEGESPVFILWALTEELRALVRIQQGQTAGRTIDQLLRENRVWGTRQALMKTALARHASAALERALLHAARIDRASKGVGPGEPWDEFISLGLELLRESKNPIGEAARARL